MSSLQKIKDQFPILKRKVKGKPLAYLDNAATTLTPLSVIEAISHHYQTTTANIHRGAHTLSEEATAKYEGTRIKMQKFLNAKNSKEIIFTSGTTDSINLIATTYARSILKPGDEVLLTHMEHHSNIVPWQMLKSQLNFKLSVANINQKGELDIDDFTNKLNSKTKIVSFVYYSNSLGTINPIEKIIALAKANGSTVVVDAAQAVAHIPIDVQKLDIDFLACSSHKMHGPTGLGILYGKETLLDAMPPYRGGGDMIIDVSFERSLYNTLPHKFEAGTPHIAGVIGFSAAIDFINHVGWNFIAEHEKKIINYAVQKLSEVPTLQLIGVAENKTSIFSFTLKDIHPHDIGTLLDDEGIAIRTGHHCTQPVMTFFNIPATARASFSLYNSIEEVDLLCVALQKIVRLFN